MGSPWTICFDTSGSDVENVTASQPYYVGSCTMVLYLAPLVCITGFFLNATCIVLFVAIDASRSTSQRSSLVPYLIALCASDAAQLFMSMFMLVTPGYQSYFQLTDDSMVGQVSSYSVLILYPLGMAANYASIWIITLICVQRYRAICHPFQTRIRSHGAIKDRRNAFLAVLALGMAAVIVNLVKYWEYTLVRNYDSDTNRSWIRLNESQLLRSPIYNIVQNQVLYPLFLYIVPMLALAVLNTKIVIAIYTARRLMPRGTYGGATFEERSVSSRQQREHRGAFMVITIVVLFFACHTGGVVMRYVPIPSFPEDAEDTDNWVDTYAEYVTTTTKWMFFRDLSNFLFNVNCLINPFVYFIFTKQFMDLKVLSVHSYTLAASHGTGRKRSAGFSMTSYMASEHSPSFVRGGSTRSQSGGLQTSTSLCLSHHRSANGDETSPVAVDGGARQLGGKGANDLKPPRALTPTRQPTAVRRSGSEWGERHRLLATATVNNGIQLHDLNGEHNVGDPAREALKGSESCDYC